MNNRITEIITRRMNLDGFWITTNSIKSNYDGKWSNCLYLHFPKESFPFLNLPKLIKNDSELFTSFKKRFDYLDTELNKLPFHGGITFYEEIYNLETENTYVKVGCDYQHLYDDEYRLNDNGELILKNDGIYLANSFIQLIKSHENKDSIK